MYREPRLTHAKIKTAEPTVHPRHPFRHQGNHERLLEYLQSRLTYGKEARDREMRRYVKIDKDVAGWMRLSDEDKERARKQLQDGIPTATQINLPLNFIHLDDMMTYYAETFAPNRGMFHATGKPNETDPANQITTLMNNHAIYAGYFRQTLLAIYSVLKYNLGGATVAWSKDYAPKIQNDLDGRTRVVEEEVWAGNRFEALDMYNTFWDPSVNPVDLHLQGEWGAMAKLRSHYWLASRAAKGIYFNCDQALEDNVGIGSATQYYRSPPAEAQLSADESTGESREGRTNWVSILSEVTGYANATGHELVEIYIRLNPNDFDLIAGRPRDRNNYETWRFTILNDKYIIETTHMNNIHGHIPMYFGIANDDFMGPAQKSPAEIIQPLQNFASFLLNSHVLATRKNIWGVTFYDPTVADYGKIPEGEVAAYIPIESTGYGKDIGQSIYRADGVLDTKQTLQDLAGVMDIVNQFFPTQQLPSQIAGIDRAIESQVAAVQHGSNRRQHKTAKLLDDSLFRPARAGMYYNIVQYQPDGAEVSDFRGGIVTINLDELRKTDLPFIIGQGLKAIDRMMIASKIQNIIFALIQSPQQAQQTDILGMIDFWTDMIDVDIDFKQFRLAPPAPVAPTGATAGPGEELPPEELPAVDMIQNPENFTQ